MTKWTFLSNLFSIQSECPAREKLGYGADIVTTANAYCYNFDMSSYYRKVVQDFVNDVRPNGGMSEIAPNIGSNGESMGGETGSPGWQLALLGINGTSPGFTTFDIKPQPAGDLTWAKGHHDSQIGRIENKWKIEGTPFYLDVTVPAYSLAKIDLPAISEKEIWENGKPVSESIGLKFIGQNNNYAVFEAVSGNYSFKSKYQK